MSAHGFRKARTLLSRSPRRSPRPATVTDVPLLYDASDLVTHAVILGMTGSGKTGLGIGLIEEAAIDGIAGARGRSEGRPLEPAADVPAACSAAEFAPWINPDEARLLGLTPEAFAEREATRWREGLAEWGQSGRSHRAAAPGRRVQRLHARAAARRGRCRSCARSRRPARPSPAIPNCWPSARRRRPPACSRSPASTPSRCAAASTSCVSTLLSEAWQQQQSLDLPALIAQVQSPPLQRIGVLELEAFFPAGDRFELASDLNRLLAAPDFAVWLEGDPLDIDAAALHRGRQAARHRALDRAPRRPRAHVLRLAAAERSRVVDARCSAARRRCARSSTSTR